MEFEKRVSVLHGDESFSNRVVSRKSLLGCSSRISYYRGTEGVPFKWEMQPGTPKNPRGEEIIPPLSPPPAVLSLGLPKPCIAVDEEPSKTSMRSKLMFWKHIKKSKDAREAVLSRSNADTSAGYSDKLEGSELCSSDGEFMESSERNSSVSTSSSTLSFSNGRHSQHSSRLVESPSRDSLREPRHGCSPWNFTSVLVGVSRRL